MAKTGKRGIPQYLESYFSGKTQLQHYLDYAKHAKQSRRIEDTFTRIKGFSSSTPMFRTSTFSGTSSGGGFYFRWHGLGIAVDPGIGFIALMHEHMIFVDDIDVVIVTHAHLDHNADVRGLASLLYEFNKGRERGARFYSSLLPKPTPVEVHTIHWILDCATYYQVKDDIDEREVTLLSDLCGRDRFFELAEDVSVKVFAIEHIHGDSYGIRFSFKGDAEEHSWGYTSDTRYFSDLSAALGGCDVLIMNISDVYEKDVEGVKPKSTHLGFDGCLRLLNSVKPSLALISEFTCMNGDYRFEIVRCLKEESDGVCAKVLPAEIGLRLALSGEHIRCSACGQFHPIAGSSAIRPVESFARIQYICDDCMI